jgi:LuxR family maltose regulon positive regulatory protein
LLAQWLASEGESRPFAWVNIDAADQDPMRLCAHVVEAIGRIEPGFGDDMRGVLGIPGAALCFAQSRAIDLSP